MPNASITITAAGIAIENGPLVAGERIAVTASGLTLADGAALTLVLEARAPTFQIANVALVEDAETGAWTGTLETATRQAALLFATAGAEESRPVVLELIDTANRDSIAILSATLRNSALIPATTPCALGPVYLPVPGPKGDPGEPGAPGEPGPPGEPRTPSDAPPAMDGEASPGSSDAYARGDHRHPVDTSRASVEDATLNQAWTVAFALTDAQKELFSLTPGASDNDYALTVKNNGVRWTLYVGSYSAASLITDANENLVLSGGDARLDLQPGDLVATPAGYVLGSQTEKPIPRLSDVPAVVAPSTDATTGQAADAKATGDALAGKLSTSGGTMTGPLRIRQIDFINDVDTVVGGLVSDAFYRNGVGAIFLPSNSGTLALTSNIPAVTAETWTFEVDGGQGGTETVTKSVAVFAAAQNAQSAQGGA